MRGIIHWFVENPIAANLLMLAMIIGGITGYQKIDKEVFPATTRNFVYVNMSYPGAAPTEVEQQIVIRIEEAVADLPGVFKIRSDSNQGSGKVSIEVIDGFDVKEILNDVKSRVDSINTFPASAERPIISYGFNRVQLMFFTLSGDVAPALIKATAYKIRDEMSVLSGISTVNIIGLKQDELGIEISEFDLRRYNLTFDQVANAIRQSSVNIPAGAVKTAQGNIQVQTRAQANSEQDFAQIVIRSNPDGSQLYLGDIATITDGFSDTQNIEFSTDGKPGLDFQAFISDEPDLFLGAKNAREYLNDLQGALPTGLNVEITYEMKTLFDGRFNLLKDNALSGLLLVYIVLMLFLRPIIAFWVVAGIATTFAGALWLLSYFGISINMLSMFAFLMVLGIVVDDAIIVGESIYSHHHNGLKGRTASSVGAGIVLKPVTLAVISTIIFFSPMVAVPAEIKPYTLSIFFVVMLCLVFSLIESLLILPSHLSHLKPEKPSKFAALQVLERVRGRFSGAMENFATGVYQTALQTALKNKVSTFLGFFVAFMISVAIMIGGWLNTSIFPEVPQAFVIVNVSVPEGSPFSESKKLADYIEKVANELREDSVLLKENKNEPFITSIKNLANENTGRIFIGLTAAEVRNVSTKKVADRLREQLGPLPQAKTLSLNFTGNGGQPDIQLNLNLRSNDRGDQQNAVDAIVKVLAAYPGVENVRSDLENARTEVEVNAKPYSEILGISLRDMAKQVRQGFYGEEVQRIPRAKEDARVMLRYTAEERSSLDTLDKMRVRTSDGTQIPLGAVADIKLVPGFTTIHRVDRMRNITITADVLDGYDANKTVNSMLGDYLQDWRKEHDGLSLNKAGNLRSQAIFGENFVFNFIKAVAIMLAFFAIAFRSIAQSFLILVAVPFGFMGAVFGHLLLGYDISMMSFFGFLACAGVVVNDNLVLLDRINQLRHRGASAFDAVMNAGVDRFRPIVLTSLTTFVGLLPILFERSGQAQFLIPMVISLSFGVVLSSFVTLFFVPCTYYLGSRVGQRFSNLRSRKWMLAKGV